MSLSLFPARVPIGRTTDSTGKLLDVLMTPEFSRALADLLVRVGGPDGAGTDDIEALFAMSTDNQSGALANQIADLTARLELQEGMLARLAALDARLQDVEVATSFRDPFRVDWDRPGTIGRLTANTVRGTTVQATGAFGCNGAAVQVAAASGGAVATTAATNAAPWGYTTQAQADGIRILLNNIRAALVANGIMS